MRKKYRFEKKKKYLNLKDDVVTSKRKNNNPNGIENSTIFVHARLVCMEWVVRNVVGPIFAYGKSPKDRSIGNGCDGANERDLSDGVEVGELSHENGHASEHQEPLRPAQRLAVAYGIRPFPA